jgi:hypothetical protein
MISIFRVPARLSALQGKRVRLGIALSKLLTALSSAKWLERDFVLIDFEYLYFAVTNHKIIVQTATR